MMGMVVATLQISTDRRAVDLSDNILDSPDETSVDFSGGSVPGGRVQ